MVSEISQPPFAAFLNDVGRREGRRAEIDAAHRAPEAVCVASLAAAASLPEKTIDEARDLARRLVEALRARPASGLVQGLMREYALSSQEGVALMCLAEALCESPIRRPGTRSSPTRSAAANGARMSDNRRRPSSMPRLGA